MCFYINCLYNESSRHPLSYSWRREDGRSFVPGTKLSDRNRVLTIKNAPLEADGNYICTCRRATGAHDSKVITLSMEGMFLSHQKDCLMYRHLDH